MDTIRTKRHKRLVEIIADERRKSGLRQTELAKRIRRSQTWVARLEGGERRLDVVEFMLLAEVIGFDPAKTIRQLAQVHNH